MKKIIINTIMLLFVVATTVAMILYGLHQLTQGGSI